MCTDPGELYGREELGRLNGVDEAACCEYGPWALGKDGVWRAGRVCSYMGM